MCPLVGELRSRGVFHTEVCVTAQHREMLDEVLKHFDVVPDHDLDIMRRGQSLFEITHRALEGLEMVIKKTAPDVVLVHGDTTTAFAASLAAFYLHVPVGHVEAGLRSRNMYSPFPEEFNRCAISLAASYNFAPTASAKRALINEGRRESSVFITGNTVIDAMASTVREDYTHPALEWARGHRLILITAHRRENIGEPMHGMFKAIRAVLDRHGECRAVYPIHPNPRVREIAEEELGGCDRIRLIEPLSVMDCHNFEARCYLCLTDSGGMQEECPAFGRPVLVMRDTTERPEGIAAGSAKLVGTNERGVYEAFDRLLSDEAEYVAMSRVRNPYGDGKACRRIADVLQYGGCKEWSP